MSLSCGAVSGNPVTKCDLSCEAAVRAKPRARLCEPWVATNKHLPSRGAATETNPYATCSIVAPLRGSKPISGSEFRRLAKVRSSNKKRSTKSRKQQRKRRLLEIALYMIPEELRFIMKLALIFCLLLFLISPLPHLAAHQKQAAFCNGEPISINPLQYPGPPM